jgi:hypothetical protein
MADVVQPKKKEPRLALVLVALITSLAVLKFLNAKVSLSKVPGPERGDMQLTADALPPQIGEWKQVRFQAPSSPAELPDGQFWWVHGWTWSNDNIACLISLDQADWTSWHDLSVCYKASGWTLNDRSIYEIPEQGGGTWHVVTLDLQNGAHQKGFVVFSLFGSDGTPMDAPQMGDNAKQQTDGILARLNERFREKKAAEPIAKKWVHERVIQSQLFMTYNGELSKDQRDSLMALYLEGRQYFRTEWNRHWADWKQKNP